MDKYTEFAEKTRHAFKSYDDVRDRDFTEPAGLKMFRDIKYGTDPMQTMDIYIPENADIPQKTIVSIHGGAYVYGDKERYRFYCMDLAMRGFTVVNFSYRLAPEAPYPAQLEDVNAVFRYISEHSGEYLIDTDNVFAVGDSAGAQLACQYAAMLTNSDYARLFDIELPDIRIKALGLNCGMYDMKGIISGGKHSDMIDTYFRGRQADFAAQLDILPNITAEFPPSFVMTSFYDHLKYDSEPLLRVFDEQGIDYSFKVYGNMGEHYMTHVFHLNIALDEAKLCNDEECAFFNAQ